MAKISAESPAKSIRFDREKLAKRYATLLTHSAPSVVVGILAPWGSGKTTVLNRTQDYLTKGEIKTLKNNTGIIGETETEEVPNDLQNKNIKCLYFSTWDHENPGGLIAAMITELAHQFKDDAATKNAQIKTAGALAGLGLDWAIRFKTFNMINLKNVGDAAWEFTSGARAGMKAVSALQDKQLNGYLHDEHNKLKDSLEEAAKALDKKGITRIALFIDDLDRCNPENIFQFLDSLRRLLSLTESIGKQENFQGFVGIIAADPDVVRQAIKAKYPRFEGDPLCYMDKLFTITHTLPIPKDNHWNDYLIAQCKAEGIENPFLDSKSLSHITNPLTRFFNACNGALTPRHANIFLRHLKIAISTHAESPYSFLNLPPGKDEWDKCIRLALLGIASPHHFNILRARRNDHQVTRIIEGLEVSQPDNIKENAYRKFSGRNWGDDWAMFKLNPILISFLSKDYLKLDVYNKSVERTASPHGSNKGIEYPFEAAAELIWL